MQKYVKNEKRYRLINFICLLAVYKKLIGTGRVLGTSILRYVPIFYSIEGLGTRVRVLRKKRFLLYFYQKIVVYAIHHNLECECDSLHHISCENSMTHLSSFLFRHIIHVCSSVIQKCCLKTSYTM